MSRLAFVIPAQAGIQPDAAAHATGFASADLQNWIPACAGMTVACK